MRKEKLLELIVALLGLVIGIGIGGWALSQLVHFAIQNPLSK
jgi:hypothetical protein